MNPNVGMFLDARARARARGDHGMVRAMNADLERAGYVDPPVVPVETEVGLETAAVRAPERAVPKPRTASKPRAKRSHGAKRTMS